MSAASQREASVMAEASRFAGGCEAVAFDALS
jgi:hypothetical protein